MMLIEIRNATVKAGSKVILDDVAINIIKGHQYAVIGPSGSGKTTLLQMLGGNLFHGGTREKLPGLTIALVSQQHRFKNLSNTASFYYQQRYNAADAEDTLTVQEYLEEDWSGYENGKEDIAVQQLLATLHVDKLLNRKLIQLSNGENKRVQLVKALLLRPQVLLLDNAFVGLDAAARIVFAELLQSIAQEGITIILVTSATYIPSFVTTILQLTAEGKVSAISKEAFLLNNIRLPAQTVVNSMKNLFAEKGDECFEYAIRMNKVNVRYYDKQVLADISWQVKKGEHWALSGPNGAGKSTLLSLINGDNPQAYANEIYLFDQRRGRGESIWDIKKKIGFVSPELHLYFEPDATAFGVVASGFFDTIGLFRKLNEEQVEKVHLWLRFLSIEKLQHQFLKNFSLGMQRMILLTRALIKNPSLLLLDEPAQGLDEDQSLLFRNMVEEICAHSDKTVIYISHYKEEIPACVTKFIHLEEGRISFMKQ